ncbi:tail assembly protein [Pasteurella multocida]|uniref:tail assembly protein n=1 Tax=Pasteurella multocida TaxID=747 RepID=UPI0014613CB7|nr:tail assembly protein [Pasteurella multocida]NMR52984.1 tail assembly protein [Pasteurella multocida]NMR62924.1 tail assembly protein [Pasteurella multocida]HDR1874522.1 tail assembly protein [Pasteurella multocida]HED4406423.1 tail assembly protein [Pasteurella multocida]HED4417079.1 tail assembly protein [Pasteurella multocida]
MDNSIATEQRTSCDIRKIRLKGELGKRFGKVHKLAVKTPAEAIRALCVLKEGFKEFLLNSEKHGIVYRFLVQREDIDGTPEEFQMQYGAKTEFHLIPVIRGSKRGGLFGLIAGAALIGLSIWNPAFLGLSTFGGTGMLANVATVPFMIGASLALGGISQLLTPIPKIDGPQERPENQPSYLFNGAVNTTQQGQPIPLLYGELIVGSAVVSAGLTDKEIPVRTGSQSNSSNLGKGNNLKLAG